MILFLFFNIKLLKTDTDKFFDHQSNDAQSNTSITYMPTGVSTTNLMMFSSIPITNMLTGVLMPNLMPTSPWTTNLMVFSFMPTTYMTMDVSTSSLMPFSFTTIIFLTFGRYFS